MKFVDRELIQPFLTTMDSDKNITERLIDGKSGIGKTALLKNIFLENVIHIEIYNSNYFYSICFHAVQYGFHDYLMNLKNCNYRDVFYATYGNSIIGTDDNAIFILSHSFILAGRTLNLEQIIAEFLLSKNINVIIFDNFEICNQVNYARVLNIINHLSYIIKTNKVLVIYAIDSSFPSEIYNHLFHRVRHIKLEGLDIKYIEAIIKDLLNNENFDCKELAEYLFSKYNGSPGEIINIFKSCLDLSRINHITQSEIIRRIVKPNFDNLELIDKLILLYLSTRRCTVYRCSLENFIKFLTYNYIGDINEILQTLIDKDYISVHSGKIVACNLIKRIFYDFALNSTYLTHCIYRYQTELHNKLNSVENADLLHFLIESNLSLGQEIEEEYIKSTLESAEQFFMQEDYSIASLYYDALLSKTYKLTEDQYIHILQTYYYCAQYEKASKIFMNYDDSNFSSYDYWFWKGNIFYMLNDLSDISCFQKAISLANTNDEKIFANIMFKEAISESPAHSKDTLDVYNNILREYKDKKCKALAVLYRNSLVLGGLSTIKACEKGIAIAQELHMEEEEIKLNHNKHFELFRLGHYEGCEDAFQSSANFFQENSRRIYEASYGFNNLALLHLVKHDYKQAKLYATSANIYAGTPYSTIATKVNAILINSVSMDVDYDIEQAVNEVEELIQKLNIQDNRIYRKTYFSSAIAFKKRHLINKAIEYIHKSERYLGTGKHINRYYNLCNELSIKPIVRPEDFIEPLDSYYNFYSNPEYELWLLAYGHI